MNHTNVLLLQLEARGVPAWELEHRFHATRRWRFDVAWPDDLVAVEVHGAVHVQGRHVRGVGFCRDRAKMNEAALLGWRVIEVCPEHIRSGVAAEWVERALAKHNDTNTNSHKE